MTITRYDHFYEGTMRRFLEQVVRAFSGFQYQTGRRNGREPEMRLVPCRMASLDRMVAHITRNLSENTLLTVPMITVAQTGLRGRRQDVQHPGHVDTRQVVEREVTDGAYGPKRGNSYTLKRLMPRPFEMTIEVAIWTSNLDQKHQLLEQISTVFYPTIDIQNSENALDWSALTMLLMEDDITFSSRSIPIGTESEIDVATLNFRLPIWINPPAQLRQQKLIEQIVMNMNDAAAGEDGELEALSRISQHIITPGNYHVRIDGGSVTLLGPGGADLVGGEAPLWEKLLNQYGRFRPAQSRIRLRIGPDIENSPEVIGTLQADPDNPNRLLWQPDPDTLPANTLQPVEAIIDPLRTFPGGAGFPTDAVGARYLIVGDMGASHAWGDITARQNDIIERTASGWVVAFRAATTPTTHHVLNLMSSKQLRWTGNEWVMAIEGEYAPGYWCVSL